MGWNKKEYRLCVVSNMFNSYVDSSANSAVQYFRMSINSSQISFVM